MYIVFNEKEIMYYSCFSYQLIWLVHVLETLAGIGLLELYHQINLQTIWQLCMWILNFCLHILYLCWFPSITTFI